MDAGKTIRVGVIGLGFMGATHIAAYNAARQAGYLCDVVAVCDRKTPRRRGELWDVGGNAVSETAQQKPAFDAARVRGFERAEDLIDDPNVDLVSICTPTDTHVPLASRALRAGKHALVEKPVSLHAEEIRKLDSIAKASGKICMPAMCMRFWPAWSWLKARIDDGQYGRCLSASFQRLSSMPRWSGFFAEGDKSGGALVDLHIHDADFVYWCFGKPESVVSSGRIGASGAVDHVTSLYFCNQPLQAISERAEVPAHQGPTSAKPHVVAEGGWDYHDGFVFRMRYIAIFEHATADFDLSRDRQLLLCRDGKSEAVALEKLSGYDVQARYLIDAISRGQPATMATLEDAAAVAELLDAERESVIHHNTGKS